MHTRQFTKDGYCVLTSGSEIQWKKPFKVIDARTVDVEGGYRHVLKDANTLRIENRYTAKRK